MGNKRNGGRLLGAGSTLIALISSLAVGMGAAIAAQGDTSRVSVDSNGTEANDESSQPSVSADGRYVAFTSAASNLDGGDTSGIHDVFVRDTQNGDTTRISVSFDGSGSTGTSTEPSISADGRHVAFSSVSSHLVAGDTFDGVVDVFAHDRQTGVTTKVSIDSNGVNGNLRSDDPATSGTGRYIAFTSSASNLVPDDTNGVLDVFVHDRQSGDTTRVSVDSTGGEGDLGSEDPVISADGRFVAFTSEASNLVTDDSNDGTDIFVHDRQTGATTRVSVDSDGGEIIGFNSVRPAISGTGRFVVFQSAATNLVPADNNGTTDVFAHDRQTGETTRVSLDSSGGEANDGSLDAAISATGRYVTFDSRATNLVVGDTNGVPDVFVHDRQTGENTRVSIDGNGVEANDESFEAEISSDGRHVVFHSDATNLVSGDGNGVTDIFAHEYLDEGGNPPTTTTTIVTTTTTTAPPPPASPGSGDGVGVVDQGSGLWTLRRPDGSVFSFFFGNPGDVPFMGDWDCDGVDTPGLYRQSDGFVYLRNTNTQGIADIRFFFGNPGDLPLAGDFDGDGCDTVSIYRSSEARWYVINALGANDGGLGPADFSYLFGDQGDVPFVGDWNNDGIDTPGLRRFSNGFVYIRNTNSEGIADQSWFYGDNGDHVFTGDYNGDGVDSIGLFRPSNTTIYLRDSLSTGIANTQFQIGTLNSKPIAGDMD